MWVVVHSYFHVFRAPKTCGRRHGGQSRLSSLESTFIIRNRTELDVGFCVQRNAVDSDTEPEPEPDDGGDVGDDFVQLGPFDVGAMRGGRHVLDQSHLGSFGIGEHAEPCSLAVRLAGDENTIVDTIESFNHLKVGLLDDLHPNLMYRIFAPDSGAKTLEFCSGLQLANHTGVELAVQFCRSG